MSRSLGADQQTALQVEQIPHKALANSLPTNDHNTAASGRSSPPDRQAGKSSGSPRYNHHRHRPADLLVNLAQAGPTIDHCSRLVVSLLFASLLTSVLATLLLSFVINSIQLNHRGLLLGYIDWDNRYESNALQLPTSFGNKSISSKSIQSANNKSLQFKVYLHPQSGQTRSIIVSSKRDNNCLERPYDSGCKSNYLALNVNSNNNYQRPEPLLELATKSLILDLLTTNSNESKPTSSHKNYLLADGSTASHLPRLQTNDGSSRQSVAEGTQRLLEMNGLLQSINLVQDSEISPSSLTSGSLFVKGQAKTSHIHGSLDRNLDIQTRNGHLNCLSVGAVSLSSRSAGINLSAFQDLTLSSPRVQLDSERLIVRSGIHCYDSISTVGNNFIQSPEQEPQTSAYNLVAIGGILVAS